MRLGAIVTDCTADGVAIGSEFIESRTIVWGAGVRRPMARPRTSFVIGDSADVPEANGPHFPDRRSEPEAGSRARARPAVCPGK